MSIDENYVNQLEQRLAALETLVSPTYEPPSGDEYSFPVVDQGVSSSQFRQMMKGVGSGILAEDGEDYPYALTPLSGFKGSWTSSNAQNRVLINPSVRTKVGEAVIDGFFHRITKPVEIDLPAVSKDTVYHITLTLDMRDERDPAGPIRIRVWQGDPPRDSGMKHVLLYTVARKPNQLLSDSTRRGHRPLVSPAMTVYREGGLPDSRDVMMGSLAILRSGFEDGEAIPGTGGLFESRGTRGWNNLLAGPWEELRLTSHAVGGSELWARRFMGGMQIRGGINTSKSLLESDILATLPNWWQPIHGGGDGRYVAAVRTTGRRGAVGVWFDKDYIRLWDTEQPAGWYRFDNIFLPPKGN